MAEKSLPSQKWLFIGAAVLIALPALITGMIYSSILRAQVTDLKLMQVENRGNWAGEQIVLRLDQLWQQIAVLSKTVNLSNPEKLREQFTMISQIDDRFSWIGVADAEGKVLISSNGMLENASVAQRPWFRSGLSGPFAGDVHEAVLLQNLLPKRDEPYRFIDFSAPIRNDKGQTVAVLGAHFDWVWIMKLVDGFRSQGEDIVLLSQDRRVLHGPPALYGQQLRSEDLAASQPDGGAYLQQWPDGRVYLTQFVPIRTRAGAPSFGWSVAVRSDAARVFEESSESVRTFWLLLGTALLVTLLGTIALVARFMSPRRLASS